MIESVDNGTYAVVTAFSKIIKYKDSHIHQHMAQVAELSKKIGLYLRMDKDTINKLWMGGNLHDVGKVGVPLEIINKSGKLTYKEYEEVKKHVLIGYELLKPFDLGVDVVGIICQHHERMDGSGYPYGLKEGEIHFLAQIVAVIIMMKLLKHVYISLKPQKNINR